MSYARFAKKRELPGSCRPLPNPQVPGSRSPTRPHITGRSALTPCRSQVESLAQHFKLHGAESALNVVYEAYFNIIVVEPDGVRSGAIKMTLS